MLSHSTSGSFSTAQELLSFVFMHYFKHCSHIFVKSKYRSHFLFSARNALVCSHDHLTLFLTLVSGLEFIRFDLELVSILLHSDVNRNSVVTYQ